MKKIVVTGANGQLGLCLKTKSKEDKALDFVFLDSKELDIRNSSNIEAVFSDAKFDYCINCAAYTAVDNAEEDEENAYAINTLGAKNLAEACKKFNVILVHISTDFVFDGKSTKPYIESDLTNPLGVYGNTKLNGEVAISNVLDSYYIIRTSWLYSEFKNNFVKTMLRLASERDEVSVVNDQIGTPTNANDLAEALIRFITMNNEDYGVYHYSNEGVASWYDFAKAIFEESNIKIKVLPIQSEAYPTPAKRPQFSVLDKSKIKNTLQIEIPHWRDSLKKAIANSNE